MSTWNLPAVRVALAAALVPVAGLNPYARVPGTIQVPAAIVEPDDPLIIFDTTAGRGLDALHLRVVVLVSVASATDAQDKLDSFLGSNSATIKNAIESAGTLGGVVQYAIATTVHHYGATYTYNGVQYAGAEFTIEVAV